MPDTLPDIPDPRTDEAVRRRQSFGAWAADYDYYRPGYSGEILQYVLSRTDIPAPHRVLDIGAGTGQLARGLLGLGCEVVAVEPDDRMRSVLATVVGEGSALSGSAESVPLPNASVDVVTCGQMWHWVDPTRALPAIARVLRPGGVLAIIWNLRDDRVDWVSAMNEVIELGDGYKWFENNETPDLGQPFGPTIGKEFPNDQPATVDSLVGLVATFSTVGLSDDADVTLGAVRQLALTHPQLAGRDEFDIPYIAKVFTAVRK